MTNKHSFLEKKNFQNIEQIGETLFFFFQKKYIYGSSCSEIYPQKKEFYTEYEKEILENAKLVKNKIETIFEKEDYEYFFETYIIIKKYNKHIKSNHNKEKFSLCEPIYIYKKRSEKTPFLVFEKDLFHQKNKINETQLYDRTTSLNTIIPFSKEILETVKKYPFTLKKEKLFIEIFRKTSTFQIESYPQKSYIYNHFIHMINKKLDFPYPKKLDKKAYKDTIIESKNTHNFFNLLEDLCLLRSITHKRNIFVPGILEIKTEENQPNKTSFFLPPTHFQLSKEERENLEKAFQKTFIVESLEITHIEKKEKNIEYFPRQYFGMNQILKKSYQKKNYSNLSQHEKFLLNKRLKKFINDSKNL